MTKILIPLADGVEELEAVSIVDTLRRGGCEVVTASVKTGANNRTIAGSRGVRFLADADWPAQATSFDAVVVPGGMGNVTVLAQDPRVLSCVADLAKAGKMTAAICAGPLVLQAAGALAGKKATCHPGVREKLTGAAYSADRVVVDGQVVTSQGPGTAIEFALTILRLLRGTRIAEQVAQAMVA